MLNYEQSQAEAAVEVSDLTRALPLAGQDLPILKGISFHIARGAWAALTGPSGSGKSTLLGLIAGLDTPTSGRIVIDGIDISSMGEGELARIRNRKIGMVFQSFNLIPSLTAQENVEVPLYVHSRFKNPRGRARQMLEMVGLADRFHHRPSQLSGGEQQRVAIARALVTEPAILVADEPTGNLDSNTGTTILGLFARLRDELGVTMVMATHDLDIASRADQVLHIIDGRLDSSVYTPIRTKLSKAILVEGAAR
jgi:putative ABC transport system ATP-binding protein